MATPNTNYLKFDSASISNRMVQLLSNNSKFTDQIFEGSDIKTFIDVFAYMFEVLTYYTNHGASEAMFSDTRLYENMNRIVKMLGYNPKGYGSSTTGVSFVTKSGYTEMFTPQTKILPKYTYIDTGLSDSTGKQVFYSTIASVYLDKYIPLSGSTYNDEVVTVVNGRWKAYNQTFIASGQPLEEFTLDLLDLNDPNNPRYVAHPYVDVYVKSNGVFSYFSAIQTGTMFGSGTSLIGPDEAMFELRLNENKKYVIKFGDGIHGSKLNVNDEIYIVYLESNGPDGKIGANVINENSAIKFGISGIDTDTFLAMTGYSSTEILSNDELAKLYAYNLTASTEPTSMEDVDSIRSNAPEWFRMQDRLVTAKDFKQYISSSYRNNIYDVYVMNNWEYMSTFQLWLDGYGMLSNLIRKNQYVYADSCDFNNVYIWTKFKYAIDQKFIEQDLAPRKVLTCEPIIMNSLDYYFVPCFKPDLSISNNTYDFDNWDQNVESWIEIVKDNNSHTYPERIKNSAITIIKDFFDPTKNKMGASINLDNLYSKLMSIPGVKIVKTAYLPYGSADTYSTLYYTGLKFATWTTSMINAKDLTLSSGNVSLQPFQFPVLYDLNLENRIKIVVESFSQTSVEY